MSGGSPLARALAEHADRVTGYLLALGAAPDEAEEVFQEVALSAAASHETPDAAIAWLLTVARRRLADHIRAATARRRREIMVPELDEAVSAAFAEDPADDPDGPSLADLHRCLSRLSPRARQLIDLRYREDLDSTAIASRVGWTEAAVRVALSKARRALDDCLRRSSA